MFKNIVDDVESKVFENYVDCIRNFFHRIKRKKHLTLDTLDAAHLTYKGIYYGDFYHTREQAHEIGMMVDGKLVRLR